MSKSILAGCQKKYRVKNEGTPKKRDGHGHGHRSDLTVTVAITVTVTVTVKITYESETYVKRKINCTVTTITYSSERGQKYRSMSVIHI
jgi:hypothetical protein